MSTRALIFGMALAIPLWTGIYYGASALFVSVHLLAAIFSLIFGVAVALVAYVLADSAVRWVFAFRHTRRELERMARDD